MPNCRSAWLAAAAIGFLFVCASFPRGRAQSIFPDQTAYTTDVCDRACLYGFVDQYLHALVDKSPSELPWAKMVRFTENNVSLQVGDGLWGTISGLGPEDLRAADPEHGQVAYFGVVYENGSPGYFALRMKIVDRKISEVETLVDRPGNGPGPFGDPAKMTELPFMKEFLPLPQRTPRARMIALAAAGKMACGPRTIRTPTRNSILCSPSPDVFPASRDSSSATIAGTIACAHGAFRWWTSKKA